jgi:hypothetical protein
MSKIIHSILGLVPPIGDGAIAFSVLKLEVDLAPSVLELEANLA